MDFSADIAYLKAQLDEVNDPSFIAKLKQMFENRLKRKEKKTGSLSKLYGVLSEEEADELERNIKDCKRIEGDW